MGHLVADAVGAPAECELGQVARAHDDAALVVGEPEEVVVAQPGLDVLERDVVDLLAAPEGVAHVRQHLRGGRPDVELGEGHPELLGEALRVGLGVLGRREPRHRVGQDVAARTPEPVHRLRAHEQRVGRVQAARDPDHGLGLTDSPHPLLEPGHLDVVGLVAVQRQPLRLVRDEREAVDLAPQADVAGGRLERELDRAEGGHAVGVGAAVVVEGALPQPLRHEPLQVDVGHGAGRAGREALGLAEQVAVLVDEGLPVPGQVGRRLTFAGRGIQVCRQAPRRGGAREELAVLGAGHRDRGAGQVGEDRGAGERGLGRRRHGHPHVLAHLDVQHEARHVGRVEEQVRAERHADACDLDLAADVVAGCEVPPLVELAVGRQVGLGGDAEDASAVDDDGAVVEPVAPGERGADDEHRCQ